MYKIILLTGLLSLICLSKCITADQCTNDILIEHINQAKTYKVVKFDRGCGATTGNSIQLSVIPVDEHLENTAGNVFIAGSMSGSYLKDDKSVSVSWLNDSTIKIKYDNKLKIFKKDITRGKLKVLYHQN
jgi:hypothetical protein